MNKNNQPGYIPYLGLVSQTKPIRHKHKNQFDRIKDYFGSARECIVEFYNSLVTYKADAILLTGKEKQSGEPLRVFYFGLGENLAYLIGLLYCEHEEIVQAVDVNPWRAHFWCKKLQADADLVALDLPWPTCQIMKNNGYLTLAPWVNMVIPIGDTWEKVVGRWANNVKGEDMRRIRKHQLNYRTIDTEQAFRNFYHAYYVPYVTKRFGDAVFIEPEEKIVAVHEYGEIIEIIRDDTVIAAGILIDVNGSLGFHWTGVPENLDPSMSDGAFAALYYFIVRLAYERGCYEVNCFTSRPTLTDGVLRYKRKWGAMLSGYDAMNGQILLNPVHSNRAVISFLKHNPFITLVNDDFIARLLFEEPKISAARVFGSLDTYYTDGLQSLRLYSLHGFEPGIDGALRERNLPVELFDLQCEDNPLQVYCNE